MNAGMAAALLVHVLDEQAKAFYLGHGFIASPIEPMTLMLSLRFSAAQTAVKIRHRRTDPYCRPPEHIVPVPAENYAEQHKLRHWQHAV
jgi:hypothetical protein